MVRSTSNQLLVAKESTERRKDVLLVRIMSVLRESGFLFLFLFSFCFAWKESSLPAAIFRCLALFVATRASVRLEKNKKINKGGTEISFTMAIDFTASNGNPADPRSLHYVDPTGMILNDYAKAMSGIGRVLEFYGKGRGWDLHVGIWGSGAVYPSHRVAVQSVLDARSTSARKADRNDGRYYACSGVRGTRHVIVGDVTPPRHPRWPALRTCTMPRPTARPTGP